MQSSSPTSHVQSNFLSPNEDPQIVKLAGKLKRLRSEDVVVTRLSEMRREKDEFDQARIQEAFARIASEHGLQIGQYAIFYDNPQANDRRFIMHADASGVLENICTQTVFKSRSLGEGVTSKVYPVYNEDGTFVIDAARYAYSFSPKAVFGYNKGILNEQDMIAHIKNRLGLPILTGLGDRAECLVLHPELGIGGLEKRYVGGDLLHRLNNDPESLLIYRDTVAAQLLEGLGFLLKANVIHLDIKPDNVLLNFNEWGMVAHHKDFKKAIVANPLLSILIDTPDIEDAITEILNLAEQFEVTECPVENTISRDLERSDTLCTQIQQLGKILNSEAPNLYSPDMGLSPAGSPEADLSPAGETSSLEVGELEEGASVSEEGVEGTEGEWEVDEEEEARFNALLNPIELPEGMDSITLNEIPLEEKKVLFSLGCSIYKRYVGSAFTGQNPFPTDQEADAIEISSEMQDTYRTALLQEECPEDLTDLAVSFLSGAQPQSQKDLAIQSIFAKYDLLRDVDQKRMLFYQGYLLYQLYTKQDPYLSNGVDNPIPIHADRRAYHREVLQKHRCPNYMRRLITSILSPQGLSPEDYLETLENLQPEFAAAREKLISSHSTEVFADRVLAQLPDYVGGKGKLLET